MLTQGIAQVYIAAGWLSQVGRRPRACARGFVRVGLCGRRRSARAVRRERQHGRAGGPGDLSLPACGCARFMHEHGACGHCQPALPQPCRLVKRVALCEAGRNFCACTATKITAARLPEHLLKAWSAARRALCAWAGATSGSTARAWRPCGRTCSCRRSACRRRPADARSAEMFFQHLHGISYDVFLPRRCT